MVPPRRRASRSGTRPRAAVLTLRADDGYDTPLTDPNFQEGTEPGEYRYTPGTPFAFSPHLGEDLLPSHCGTAPSSGRAVRCR